MLGSKDANYSCMSDIVFYLIGIKYIIKNTNIACCTDNTGQKMLPSKL